MEAVVSEIDGATFRRTLGHFCTGVTVVTGSCDGQPVGFACQSFSALSLDPPLVLFCPGKNSRAWPLIERSGHFCVNVLAAGQRDVSSVFGRKGEDKFAGLSWSPAPSGSPLLDGTLTWLDCAVESVLDGGDHHIVIGRVQTLGETTEEDPLLFYKGAYTGITRPTTPAQYWPEDFLTGTPEDWL